MRHDLATPAGQEAAVREWLGIFLSPGQITEVKTFTLDGDRSAHVFGTFEELDKLAAQAVRWSRAGVTSVYFSPNPLSPDLQAAGCYAKQEYVLARRWLHLDIEHRNHGNGLPATDEEKVQAWEVVTYARGILDSAGMSGAVVCDSGNGWHVFYPIDMPADELSKHAVKSLLRELSARCSTPEAILDPSTYGAAANAKVYGTVSRRGEATADRPHRFTWVVEGASPPPGLAAKNTVSLFELVSRFGKQAGVKPPRKKMSAAKRTATGTSGYGVAATKRECDAIRGASQRNNQLNQSAFAIGQLVAGGEIDRETAEESLFNAAVEAGLPEHEARQTLRSGIEAGMKQPRSAPPREEKAKPDAGFRMDLPARGAKEAKVAVKENATGEGDATPSPPTPRVSAAGSALTEDGYLEPPPPGLFDDPAEAEKGKTRTVADIVTIDDLAAAGAQVTWLWEGWIQSGVLTALAAEGGCGKCFAKGTPVLMADGAIRPVEDVHVGDRVMGPDSKPKTVTALGRGREMMYRVTPVKGDVYVVNESHILSLKMTGLGKGSLSKKFTKNQTVNISIRDYFAETKAFRRHANGWRVGVEWAEVPVPLDPYLLGLWLGDGTTRGPSICKPDAEVGEALGLIAEAAGLRLTRMESADKCPVWTLAGAKGTRAANPVYSELKSMGVVKERHIPHVYKANSREVRLAVLAGLLDTDGHMHGGGFDYISASERLSRDVAFLSRSLGLAAYVKPCVKRCQTGAEGTYWRVSISGDCSVIPTRIPRKRAPARNQKKDVLRTGIRVEPVGEGDYYGFTLDGDGLFLLGDFTVVHNTRFTADLVRRIRHGKPWPDGQPMTLPQDSTALWVVSDNNHDEMVTLAQSFGIVENVRINAWKDDPYGGTSLETREDLVLLHERIKLLKPALVVIDTVGNATDKNLSKQEDAKAFYQPLQVIARAHRTAILCLTHLNANGKFLGRRVMEKVRVALKMDKPDPNDDKRALRVEKSNSKRPKPLGVIMGDKGNEYDDQPPVSPEDDAPVPGKKPAAGRGKQSSGEQTKAESWLNDWLSTGCKPVSGTINAANEAGVSTAALYRAKDKLAIYETKAFGRKYWSLEPPENEGEAASEEEIC